jgi:hypothetical protein
MMNNKFMKIFFYFLIIITLTPIVINNAIFASEACLLTESNLRRDIENKTEMSIVGPKTISLGMMCDYVIHISSKTEGFNLLKVAIAFPKYAHIDLSEVSIDIRCPGDTKWTTSKLKVPDNLLDKIGWLIFKTITGSFNIATGPTMGLVEALNINTNYEQDQPEVDLRIYDIYVIDWTSSYVLDWTYIIPMPLEIKIRIPASFHENMVASSFIPLVVGTRKGYSIGKVAIEKWSDLHVALSTQFISSSSVVHLTKELIRNVQKALDEQGFKPGPIDGIFGPKTREALKKYQDSNDLVGTGQLNSETLINLGITPK